MGLECKLHRVTVITILYVTFYVYIYALLGFVYGAAPLNRCFVLRGLRNCRGIMVIDATQG